MFFIFFFFLHRPVSPWKSGTTFHIYSTFHIFYDMTSHERELWDIYARLTKLYTHWRLSKCANQKQDSVLITQHRCSEHQCKSIRLHTDVGKTSLQLCDQTGCYHVCGKTFCDSAIGRHTQWICAVTQIIFSPDMCVYQNDMINHCIASPDDIRPAFLRAAAYNPRNELMQSLCRFELDYSAPVTQSAANTDASSASTKVHLVDDVARKLGWTFHADDSDITQFEQLFHLPRRIKAIERNTLADPHLSHTHLGETTHPLAIDERNRLSSSSMNARLQTSEVSNDTSLSNPRSWSRRTDIDSTKKIHGIKTKKKRKHDHMETSTSVTSGDDADRSCAIGKQTKKKPKKEKVQDRGVNREPKQPHETEQSYMNDTEKKDDNYVSDTGIECATSAPPHTNDASAPKKQTVKKVVMSREKKELVRQTPYRFEEMLTTELNEEYAREVLHRIVFISTQSKTNRRNNRQLSIFRKQQLLICEAEQTHLLQLATQCWHSWNDSVRPLILKHPTLAQRIERVYTLDVHCVLMLIASGHADTHLHWLGKNNPFHGKYLDSLCPNSKHLRALGISTDRMKFLASCLCDISMFAVN